MKIRKTETTLIILMLTISFFSCSNDNTTVEETNTNPETNPESNQESVIEFVKHFETQDSIFTLNSAIQLSDSSYTIAGAVRYNGSFNKNLLMKFDKYGNRKWTKVMESTYTPDGIEKLFHNGNGYIGYRGHHFDVENSSHFIHYNQNGNVENEFFLNKDFWGNDILKVENNFLIAGNSGDMAFRMLNQDGELIWETIFEFYPEAFSISRLTDDNYITIGGGNYTGQGDYLIKLNEFGEEIWSRYYSGLKVLGITNNEFLAVTNLGTDKGNLTKFDESGNKIWTKPLPNFRADINNPSPLNIICFNNDFIVCTYTNKNLNLNILVVDHNGNEINSYTIDEIPGGEYTMVSKTIDDGLIIASSGPFYEFDIIKLSKQYLLD